MADVPEEQGGAETTPQPSESAEQTASPEVSETAEAQPDQPESKETPAEGKEDLSERGQKRIQQLANERNAAVSSLREIAVNEEEQSAGQPQEQTPPWMQRDPMRDLGPEVTPDQYRNHVRSEADRLVQLRMQQYHQSQQREKALDQDINYLEKEYPELAGDIEDKRLASSLERAKKNYSLALRANPDARLKDFIEPIMEARSGGLETGRETASASLAEQKKQGAVTPSTTTSADHQSSEDQVMQMLKEGKITAKEAEEQYPDLF